MRRPLEIVQRVELRVKECGDEPFVLLLRHRGVEVIAAVAFVVARLPVELREVERLGGDDRRDGVVEIETVAAEKVVDRLEERMRRERAGGDDEEVGIAPVERRHLLAMQRDVRRRGDRLRHGSGELVAIDRECVARRDACRFGACDHGRVHQLHLMLQQADGIRLRRRAEGVGADELREIRGLVRGGRFRRPHLEQVDRVPLARERERAFTSGEAGADDLDAGHRSSSKALPSSSRRLRRGSGRTSPRRSRCSAPAPRGAASRAAASSPPG